MDKYNKNIIKGIIAVCEDALKRNINLDDLYVLNGVDVHTKGYTIEEIEYDWELNSSGFDYDDCFEDWLIEYYIEFKDWIKNTL